LLRSVKYGLYGAVLAGVVGGTVAWTNVDKTVHLVVDGQSRTIHTSADSVGQVVKNAGAAPPVPMLGHVTSSYFSAFLGHAIALALVKGGRDRMGEAVHVPLADGRVMHATIVKPLFVDAEGVRQNG